MLLPELAEKIVREVRKLIDEEIIVVDTNGVIIASTSLDRAGTFHEGALIAVEKKRKLVISEKDTARLKGVKAGINLPIFFQQEVIGVIGITGDPVLVTPFAEIIRKMTELFISENYYAEQFDWHLRAMETFVLEWIQAREITTTLQERARMLAVDLEQARTAVIVEFIGIEPLTRDVWAAIFQTLSKNIYDVAARSGNERVIWLTGLHHKEIVKNHLEQFLYFLKTNFGITAIAGVGQEYNAQEILRSYEQAERALKIASQKGSVVFDEELTLEMISGELKPEIKTEFIGRTIGPILPQKELLETIRELFIQNHSLKKTAESLHIHINTLHYRLKKVEELTKLNPGRIHDLLCLYMAVMFLEE
ncbi:sugar diacid recognition domain-containing protein [Neobacillus mesonae]|uniref:CdaR family transcriptional regulator n=1 Tax=Neobacillus mesonae TaxID=1193713 RepID=UPI00203A77A2|nr:sugar diacid recognition domain-containing protein [Neobacillus mesonae]MCM3570992.1 helix-turn-helix domain-containing protein [Neobacillus mesonae]